MKSESDAHWDRDTDDIMDLIKMQDNHKQYIQKLCIPFKVKLFRLEQPHTLEHVCNESK